MFRTIIWFINFTITLVASTPRMIKYKSLIKAGKEREAYEYAHKIVASWSLKQVKMAGAEVKVYGEENLLKDETVLYVSNHQGNFDIPIILSYIDAPKGFIAKLETKKIPIVRTWMEYINCVFMDRSNLRKSAEAIALGIRKLKAGYSMVIFPEGTRSKGGPIGEFKAGSFKLATKPKVPIIPITIKGSYKLMEERGNKITPGTVEVFIHPAIYTDGLSREEIEALPKKVQDIIGNML